MTVEDRDKLKRLDAALAYTTELFGLRVPVRQLRLLCSLVNDPVPPRTVQELSDDLGTPVSTTWADMMRFGPFDRHGAPGLDIAASISDRLSGNIAFAINRKGLQVADRILDALAATPVCP